MRRMTGNGGGHGAVKAEKLLPKTKRTETSLCSYCCCDGAFPVAFLFLNASKSL